MTSQANPVTTTPLSDRPLTAEDVALLREGRDTTDRGRVVWMSSGPDEGPDCGIGVGLGEGRALFVGELADQTVRDSGVNPDDFPGIGWWIALEDGDNLQVVGAVADQEAARALADSIAASLTISRPPSVSADPVGGVTSGAGEREQIARLIDPRAFDGIPEPMTRFHGMSYSDPENGHHVWDRHNSAICSSNGPDNWRDPWPKLASREEADAAANRLNNADRQPFLSAQEKALAKADLIIALRARTSEPEAGEAAGVAVTCRNCGRPKGAVHLCGQPPGIRPFHPSPATADKLRVALRELVTAVCYAAPPKDFNGVIAYEARVPVEFIDAALSTLSPKEEGGE